MYLGDCGVNIGNPADSPLQLVPCSRHNVELKVQTLSVQPARPLLPLVPFGLGLGGRVGVEGALLLAIAPLAAVGEGRALQRLANHLLRAGRGDHALAQLAARIQFLVSTLICLLNHQRREDLIIIMLLQVPLYFRS